MSYAVSAALQVAVFGALSGDAALDALVSGAIFDADPTGALPAQYVSLGAERARDRSDGSTGSLKRLRGCGPRGSASMRNRWM